MDYSFYSPLDPQLLFIHIPKTGGTSIRNVMNFNPPNRENNIRKHYKAIEIIEIIGEKKWENAFKFAFVRNPYERLVSHYLYRKKNQKLKLAAHYNSFKDWCLLELSSDGQKARKRFLLMPQLDWLENENHQICLDFIGRFENLANDYQQLLTLINGKFSPTIPFTNQSKKYDYRTFYDDQLIELVTSFYKKDIDFFNYQF